MAFAFKKSEPLAAGVTRIVGREAHTVLESLAAKSDVSPQERVHQARKHLKKIRALLRLVRDEVGETTFRLENSAYRDVARALAEVRDAQVLPETLDALLAHYDEPAERWCVLRERLARAGQGQRPDVRTAAREMRRALKRVPEWEIRHDGWKGLRDGLKATYARARGRFAMAYETPTAIHFHEWRKSVKYLRHHIDLLTNCWKRPLEQLSDELHELSNFLGNDHDLAVLRERAGDEQEPALVSLIERRQAELRAQAEPLARRLFAEKPGAFTRRVHEYWDAWHEPIAPRQKHHFARHAYAAQP